MAFEIILTKRAEKDFENILQYILLDFGQSAAVRFKDLTFEFLSILEKFPEIGIIVIAEKSIRSIVIHKRLKVFYRIKGTKIILLRLFDTRQHPGSAIS